MTSRRRDRFLTAFLPPVAAAVNALIFRLNRFEIIHEDIPCSFWDRGEKVILCFWHDQMLLMNRGYRGEGIKILISSSGDGEIIARVMARFGHGTVRGSTSRGGGKAFRGLLAGSREGFDLAITPDGPKGPRHQVKAGAVRLARLSGRPIIPMSLACSRGHRFSSWDRFLLPYPFGRLVIRFGPPVFFPWTDDPEEDRMRLEQALKANDEGAREALETRGVSAI